MAPKVKYRLSAKPEPSVDGSMMVKHDIWGIVSENGDDWSIMPNHHKTFEVPANELEAVMNLPHATGPQKQAKNTAYRQALSTHKSTKGVAFKFPDTSDWSEEGMLQYYEDYKAVAITFSSLNVDAALQAQRADDYITNVLNLDYANGIDFNLSL